MKGARRGEGRDQRSEAYWREEARRLIARGEGPTMEDLGDWLMDGVGEAVDGCPIEPDGVCPHGAPSWLLVYGVI